MNYIILIVAILAMAVKSLCQTDAEIYKIKEECFDLSDVPMEKRKAYNPEDPKLKCFNACSYSGVGMMKSGKMVVEQTIERMLSLLDDVPKLDVNAFIDHVRNCTEIANKETDECEVAYVMIKCL